MTIDNARFSTTQPERVSWQHPELRAFFSLAEWVPIGLLFVNCDRGHVWANSAFHEMTELTQEGLKDLRNVHHLLSQDPDTLVQWSGYEPRDLRLTRQDGTHCPAKAVFLNLDVVGIQHISGYIGIFQDMSERMSLEKQLFHLQRLSNVGTLVSSIAHELNNPLTTVIGFSELVLTREDIPCDAREDLEAIIRQAQQGLCAVHDLLNYVHLQSEDLTSIDINHLIRELVCFRTRALKISDLDITLDLADSLPPLIGDPRHLQQVIFNLIDNAEQACASVDRKGELRIRTQQVDGDRYIRISVSDNGPGIPPEIQPHIFKPFFTTQPCGQGIGLGLSISQQIIERHGGHIWLESTPDKGATFLIDLPDLPTPALRSSNVSFTSVRQSDSLPAHILVIDDEKSISRLLTKMLAKHAHHVDVANSGNEALHRLQETAYDLVFLDLKLPGLPGKTVYSWIKQNRTKLSKRTVVLTGDSLNVDTADFLEREGITHLLKPFHLSELRAVLKQVWPG
jgi:signal transduction histidine kinase